MANRVSVTFSYLRGLWASYRVLGTTTPWCGRRYLWKDTFCPNVSKIPTGNSGNKHNKKIVINGFYTNYTVYSERGILTCIAVRAATIAGLPNPCDINEKCVKCRCIDGSSICCGLVLHNGDLSWFSKSINSLVICLQGTKMC